MFIEKSLFLYQFGRLRYCHSPTTLSTISLIELNTDDVYARMWNNCFENKKNKKTCNLLLLACFCSYLRKWEIPQFCFYETSVSKLNRNMIFAILIAESMVDLI